MVKKEAKTKHETQEDGGEEEGTAAAQPASAAPVSMGANVAIVVFVSLAIFGAWTRIVRPRLAAARRRARQATVALATHDPEA